MRNFKKTLFAMALIALVISPIFAIQVMNVTWQWSLDDTEVTAYRYQLNGEEDDKWTVVDGSVGEYSATSLDPYSDYTLYLQASYDGSLWSESAQSTAKAMLTHPVAVEGEAEVLGTKAAIRVYDDSVEITYPSDVVTPNDAKSFLDFINKKYSDYLVGASFEISEGETVLSLQYKLTEDDKSAVVDIFKSEVDAYISTLFAPVVEEAAPVVEKAPAVVEEPVVAETSAVVVEPVAEEQPAVVEAPVVAEAPVSEPAPAVIETAPVEASPVVEEARAPKAKYSNFRFSMIPTLGAEYRFDNFTSFEKDNIYPRAAIAFDFANIIPMGRHFGLGLRSDISVGLIPSDAGYSAFDSFKSVFNSDNWWEDSTADLKLTATISSKHANFYLGGGVGYSIINPPMGEAYAVKYGHSLGTLSAYFSTAWGPTGIVGMRLYMGNVFSLGLEGSYRYLLPAEKHYVSANLALGFTF